MKPILVSPVSKVVVGLLALVMVVGGQVSRVIGQRATREPAPAGLLNDLEHMDDELRRLIADWEHGRIGGVDHLGGTPEHRAFTHRAKEIEAKKLALVSDGSG